MAKLGKFYKCEICGNVVSVVEEGIGTLVCCNQDMTLLNEKTKKEETGSEKHVPVVEISKNKVKVTVGETLHPMEEKHYISLIQLLKGDEVIVGKRLKPGEKPIAEFYLEDTSNIKARILCNVHGLWIN